MADRNPPTLHLRARNSSDLQKIEKHPSYIALEHYAFSEYGLAAMSHRGGVFGHIEKLPPAVKYGLTMLFVQAEFGLCCPLSMTDSLTRTLCKFGSQELIDRFFLCSQRRPSRISIRAPCSSPSRTLAPTSAQ